MFHQRWGLRRQWSWNQNCWGRIVSMRCRCCKLLEICSWHPRLETCIVETKASCSDMSHVNQNKFVFWVSTALFWVQHFAHLRVFEAFVHENQSGINWSSNWRFSWWIDTNAVPQIELDDILAAMVLCNLPFHLPQQSDAQHQVEQVRSSHVWVTTCCCRIAPCTLLPMLIDVTLWGPGASWRVLKLV